MTEILVDSSVLINLFIGKTGDRIKAHLQNHRLSISLITYYEALHFGYKNGLPVEPVKERLQKYPMKPLTPKICERAANLAHSHGFSMADALIYATSLEAGIKLATSDSDLKGKKGVVFMAPKN
ncbi:MAG TPA: PIN domain-containing protein [Candidatus Norongarragalinales archaeon]|nr:PIN domain-containing protein [Candidatus Norongarragalinales archaeon]